ncbi:hypothetical protein EJ08DRAFT_146958 [Tothia fuscella]|uniref:Uncharacterized protein n=1 Tax=Tothia fuscella TaxID=1048955 RepID=A0A9P4P366_9PEZI|nr:hypothetical protein EJ08DRAFT_146958 [Tothia fuscella]
MNDIYHMDFASTHGCWRLEFGSLFSIGSICIPIIGSTHLVPAQVFGADVNGILCFAQ